MMERIFELTGTVVEIIYTNPDNGYTVCDIENQDEGLFTATGYMPYVSEGEELKMTGSWVSHPDYGEQFKVDYYETLLPRDEEAVVRYLASGIVSGVREATAKRLVEHFGPQLLDIMLTEPERLSELKGISKERAKKIGESFARLQSMQNIVMFLQQYHISANLAMRVHQTLGRNAVELIEKNPYILAERVEGISFKTADNIAFVRGIPKNSAERIRAGIKYMLSNAAYTSGHTYLPKSVLIEHAAYTLNIDEAEVENGLDVLMLEKDIYLDQVNGHDVYYLTPFLTAELYVARRIASMAETEQKFTMPEEEVLTLMEEISAEEGIGLASEQREAVITAARESCMVITGGPGTGKTTAIKTIIRLMERLKLEVALAAPTGRAAKRMSEVTGLEAKTLHRLLGVQRDSDRQVFTKNEENPLSADVIIVDEMSMVDIVLMHAFLRAVKPGARVIFAGDADQLPSVGPGNVLKDIIAGGIVPVIRLEHIFRQAQESLIVVNAHRINHGELPELGGRDSDFFFLRRSNSMSVLQTVVDLYKNRLPNSYGLNPLSDIQVLSPSKKGTAGVLNLNQELQAAVNPEDMAKPQYQYGRTVFRMGDKVMQTKNNYDIPWTRGNGEVGAGIFNGDMGIIENISVRDKMMTILFDDDKEVEYLFSYLDELELAYAITVHKSQGSEFPVVIMPMCNFPPMLLCRNLFYTAVTRARELVVLVGGEKPMVQMVRNNTERERFTGLSQKLQTIRKMLEEDPFEQEDG